MILMVAFYVWLQRKNVQQTSKVEINCLHCGKSFFVYPCRSKRKYCSAECFRKHPIRGKYTFYVKPIAEQMRLLAQVQKLHAEGLGYIRIAQALELPEGTVQRWINRNIRKFYRAINLEPSAALAYVLGVCLGDGCVYASKVRKTNQVSYIVKLGPVKDKDFAEHFAKSLGQVLNREYKVFQDKKSYFNICASSKHFFEFYQHKDFTQIMEAFLKNSSKDLQILKHQ